MKNLIVCSLLCLAARVAIGMGWSFSNDAITDGNWTLSAQLDSSAKTLTIKGFLSGSGVLDLDDPVVDGVEIQKVYFWNQVFEKQNAVVTEFRCNRFWQPDANNMTWALFRYNQSLTNVSLGGPNGVHLWADTVRGCSNLVSLVLDFPNQTNISNSAFSETPKLASVTIRSAKHMELPNGFFKNRAALKSVTLDLPANAQIPQEFFSGCTNLSELILNMGRLTNVSAFAFMSCSKLAGDIADYCPPSVETVGSRAFEGCSCLTGRLVLTNLCYLGDAAFAWTKIQDLELRGPVSSANWVNGSYPDGVRFTGVNTMTNAVFDLPNLSRLCEGDFKNCWRLNTVYFLRKPFEAESLRYMLHGKGLSPMTCTLFVSSQQWPAHERAAYGCRSLTAEEKSDPRKPARCLGMYEGGRPEIEENGITQQRLAWFARWPSPYDVPQGLHFFIR